MGKNKSAGSVGISVRSWGWLLVLLLVCSSLLFVLTRIALIGCLENLRKLCISPAYRFQFSNCISGSCTSLFRCIHMSYSRVKGN